MPPDSELGKGFVLFLMSQCTYRCVVLPDEYLGVVDAILVLSQCTYRCVVLPDQPRRNPPVPAASLNAPTGAWCSLTNTHVELRRTIGGSQCTYRCVVLPDYCHARRSDIFVHVSMHLQVRGAP